jgi:hypothetical protein
MKDKDFQQLLEDYHNLSMDYERLYSKLMSLKDLIQRIRRFYPGTFEECATLNDLNTLMEDDKNVY